MNAVTDVRQHDRGKRSFTKELWFLVVVALALAFLMKTFLIQAFYIPSGSMEKTLHGCDRCTGDRVLVNKLVYRFRDVHRGEIVVFNGKNTGFPSNEAVDLPTTPLGRVLYGFRRAVGAAAGERDFIKRVIGVPGDTVACCVDGKVTINGEPIEEPYVYLLEDEADEPRPMAPFPPEKVPEGHLFVMGDNRHGSSDSRTHGTIPVDSVVGRAFTVFWPVTRIKTLRVPGTFQQPAAAAFAPEILGVAMAVPITVVRRRVRRSAD